MVTIYKKKSIPKGMELIELNDVYFNKITSGQLDQRADAIILKIDGANRIDQYMIQSKFDKSILNIDKLSTGCKTVLNIMYNADKVFDIRECGDNAVDIIYSLPEGNVTCDYPLISFDVDKVRICDDTDEKILTDYDSIKEWWGK